VADHRRGQRIGRREIDLWREHRIEMCDTLTAALDAWVQELRAFARDYPTGEHGPREAEIATQFAKRLAAEIDKYRAGR
jgi:hypothetical protein